MDIKSMAKIKYSYDLEGISLNGLATSNVVKTEVRKFNLLLKKLSNQEFFQENDIITYTLIISNTGNFKNTNVYIKDQIKDLEFINNSIRIMSLSNENINSTFSYNEDLLIKIDEINPNEVIIITYKVRPNKAVNLIDTITTIKSDETNLEEIKNQTLKQGFVHIECSKAVSSDVTFIDTDLTYILQLSNKGNISAYNVEVFDELPITFLLDKYNPVTLNNNLIKYKLEGNILKLLIPTIEPNAVIDIKINGRIVE